jgi:hypothetical protein
MAAPDGHDAWILDLGLPRKERRKRQLPAMPDQRGFLPTSWAPDGKALLGWSIRADGSSVEGIFRYSFDSGAYEKVSETGTVPVWLRGGRSFLMARYGPSSGIYLVESPSRPPRLVLSAAFDPSFGGDYSFGLSRDDRRISFTETRSEGDIWSMTLR